MIGCRFLIVQSGGSSWACMRRCVSTRNLEITFFCDEPKHGALTRIGRRVVLGQTGVYICSLTLLCGLGCLRIAVSRGKGLINLKSCGWV